MSLFVLCPNGRRVTIKVNPNMSILQIIEEACLKYQYDPDLYNMKHYNRILDVTSTVRYSNIPNNCVLELVESTVPRQIQSVIVNISLSSGEKLVSEFPASCILWDILYHHEQVKGQILPSSDSDFEPVIVYAMRKLKGDELKRNSLKSLGITHGKCMLRFTLESKHNVGVQANVSKPLVSKKQSEDYQQLTEEVIDAVMVSPKEESEDKVLSKNKEELSYPSDSFVKGGPDIIQTSSVPDIVSSQESFSHPDIVLDRDTTEESYLSNAPLVEEINAIPGSNLGCETSMVCDVQESDNSSNIAEECNLIPLGARDAFLYSMNDAPPTMSLEEDDEFFELSLHEMQKLYQEQVELLKEIEENPLLTGELREMRKQEHILRTLNRYKYSSLRIIFPDNLVIQAKFKSVETVARIREFLKPFLIDFNMTFQLCFSFPRVPLSWDATLFEANLVPKARVYFAPESNIISCLSEEALSKKSSFSAVVKNPLVKRASSLACSSDISEGQLNTDKEERKTRRAASKDTTNVPKWLKLGK